VSASAPKRGDAFASTGLSVFGTLISINPARGICYVALQGGQQGEIAIDLVRGGMDVLTAKCGHGRPGQ
jgi:hypothetical protein